MISGDQRQRRHQQDQNQSRPAAPREAAALAEEEDERPARQDRQGEAPRIVVVDRQSAQNPRARERQEPAPARPHPLDRDEEESERAEGAETCRGGVEREAVDADAPGADRAQGRRDQRNARPAQLPPHQPEGRDRQDARPRRQPAQGGEGRAEEAEVERQQGGVEAGEGDVRDVDRAIPWVVQDSQPLQAVPRLVAPHTERDAVEVVAAGGGGDGQDGEEGGEFEPWSPAARVLADCGRICREDRVGRRPRRPRRQGGEDDHETERAERERQRHPAVATEERLRGGERQQPEQGDDRRRDAEAPFDRAERPDGEAREIGPPGERQQGEQEEERQMDQRPEVWASERRRQRAADEERPRREGRQTGAAQEAERDPPAAAEGEEPAPPRAGRRQRDSLPRPLHEARGAEGRHAERPPVAGRREGVGADRHGRVGRRVARRARRCRDSRRVRDDQCVDRRAIEGHGDTRRRRPGGAARRHRQLHTERAVRGEGEARRAEDQRRGRLGPAIGLAVRAALAVEEVARGGAVVRPPDDDRLRQRARVDEEEGEGGDGEEKDEGRRTKDEGVGGVEWRAVRRPPRGARAPDLPPCLWLRPIAPLLHPPHFALRPSCFIFLRHPIAPSQPTARMIVLTISSPKAARYGASWCGRRRVSAAAIPIVSSVRARAGPRRSQR